MSSRPTTSDLASDLRELLAKAREEGSLDSLLASLEDAKEPCGSDETHEFEFIPKGGGMSDAAKRRMSRSPDRMSLKQPPLSPQVGRQSETPACSVKLPEGIRDLHQWGMTLLEHGKYHNCGMSYAEIVTSPDEKHQGYCKWMLSRMDLTPPIRHFVNYMQLFRASKSGGSDFFPGSMTARKFKS